MTEHKHLFELPGSIVRKGSKTKQYRDELLWSIRALKSTNHKVQMSANKACFLIKEITSNSSFLPQRGVVLESVEDFVYHYENYSLRVFIFRERILLFLNSALKIDFPEKAVDIRMILDNPITKKAKLISVVEKFSTASANPLGQLVKGRNTLTHKLYYGASDRYLRPEHADAEPTEAEFKEWSKKWAGNIIEKAKQVDSATSQIYGIDHALAEKVEAHRLTLK